MTYGRQLALLDDPLEVDFQQFIHSPRGAIAYRELVGLARSANARGQRLGIGCLWETLRYSLALKLGDDGLKLNNNHRSRMARLVMANERDLAGYFHTRSLRTDAGEACA